jgi:phosphatidylinositol-3-phosphatase
MDMRSVLIMTLVAVLLLSSILIFFYNGGDAQHNTTSSTTYSTSIPPQGMGKVEHVMIIVLENEEYSNIIGSANAPYQNSLADRYALAANFFGVAHPSEPNYIAMIAGSTLNITNDGSVSENQQSSTNLVDLMKARNVSWKAYQESMPSACYKNDGPDGLYVAKHNPFVYMTDITSNMTYCKEHVVGLDELYSDLSSGLLPQYSFITPNYLNDGHDTNVAYADNWLSGFMPALLDSSAFNSSVIVLTYDEGTTALQGGGRIATIIIGPNSIVIPGFRSQLPYDHYSLLATVEAIFGLGNLGRNDANAAVMRDFFAVNVLPAG